MGWLENWKKLDAVELSLPEGWVDLREAEVAVEPRKSERLEFLRSIVRKEVEKKARVAWKNAGEGHTKHARVVLRIDEAASEQLGSEGYAIKCEKRKEGQTDVIITGTTARGVMFGAGRLLREMQLDYHISYSKALVSMAACPSVLNIVSRPKYAMRQHQVAYRPKTNSYDAFSPERMCQEVLELALFGCNGIEMIPPGVDDAMQSPNFTIPWLDMLGVVSEFCDMLDINVSMWYPAFFKSYDGAQAMDAAQRHWRLIFGSLKRLDVLFVPGGDPGGRPGKEFFRVVEAKAAFMRKHFFPKAQVWVSSQYGLSMSLDLGLTEPWEPLAAEAEWMECLRRDDVRKFINGVVYGPWSAVPISEFRAQVPECYPLRNYPDLCHVQTCEMPVSTWDLSFPLSNGRESVNPRPVEMSLIIEDQAPHTIGCGCYSEGVNDDVNKQVWTAQHWGGDVVGPLKGASSRKVLQALLMQYASYSMELPRLAGLVTQGILALERNWYGDLRQSVSIKESMQVFTELRGHLMPRHLANWRLSMMMFRATHDAFLFSRLNQERAAGSQAVHFMLRDDLTRALAALNEPYLEPAMSSSSYESKSLHNPLDVTRISSNATITHQYARLMALAATLFHQTGLQLSVGLGGQHRQRGAYLDLCWVPLGGIAYLNRVLCLLAANRGGLSQAPLSPREDSLLRRFLVSLEEKSGRGKYNVLWYASFGDEAASELPCCSDPPTRTVPVSSVLPPYRPLMQGEDPVYFARPLTEFLDASNDRVFKELHQGWIPREWCSYIEPIWPRTASFEMRFPLKDIIRPPLHSVNNLALRVTYLGADLNCHGGDWEELGREGQPLRLLANGVQVHDYLRGLALTETRDFDLPKQALDRAEKTGTLVLSFEAEYAHKTTYRYVPHPIAELWLLERTARASSKL